MPDGQKRVPGQGTNAFIFPGIGLSVLSAGSTIITHHDMLIAAGKQVTQDRLDVGCFYPPLSEIRSVSSKIAVEKLMHGRSF
jgi:malate dehydrogenase (oxaloacetate-decarboxylating)(NADP+)